MKMGKLTIQRIELTRDVEDGPHFLPQGTPGLLLGRRAHFDLSYALQHGRGWNCAELPIFQDLAPGTDYRSLGEWDGSWDGFTEVGRHLNPLLTFKDAVP
jgi:hypothetical protein